MAMVQGLRSVVSLSLRKLLVFAVLWAVVIGGYVQSYAFIDDLPNPQPKPPRFDVLRPLPLWPLAVMVLAPLLAAESTLHWLGQLNTAQLLHSVPGIVAAVAVTSLHLYMVSGCLVELVRGSRRPIR
jgi:hypothetical protein